MAHAGPSPTLYDAPEEVARLYRVWRDGPVGDRYGLLWDLEHAMYAHRLK